MNHRTLISRHRGALMGVAAVLILLFHAEWKTAPFPLGYISREGQIGVDVFVFLTGFGLARSLNARPAAPEYWSRRLRRLLPAYYVWFGAMALIAAGLALIGHPHEDFLHWLALHLLPVGVWLNHQPQVWYVSAALGYCAMAPLFFALMDRARFPRLLAAALVLLTGVVLPSVSGMDDVEIALMRVPGLIVGLAVGIAAERDDPRRRSGLLCLIVLAAAGLGLAYVKDLPLIRDLGKKRLHRLTLDCLAPMIAVVLALGFEGLGRTPLKCVNRAFEALGRVSLEVYLTHIILNGLIRDTLRWPAPLVLATLLLTAYPMAKAMQWLAKRLLSLWERARGEMTAKPGQG